jgi:sec-independent protein translocase protein TatC
MIRILALNEKALDIVQKTTQNNTEAEQAEEREMSFLDHLEELRWRLIKALLGIVVGMALCFAFIDWIMANIMIKPAVETGINLQNLKPFGQVLLYVEVALIGGIIISVPNILYQLWKFIAPGLLPRERKYISSIVAFSSVCFLAGIAFAYFVILPTALKFFAVFGSPDIANNIAINEYMSFIVSLMLGAGIVFELPMVSWFLSKLGILTPAFMRHYRRHAIVAIFILAALLTPGTDPMSQIFLAVPLVGLYEISIWVSKAAQKKG